MEQVYLLDIVFCGLICYNCNIEKVSMEVNVNTKKNKIIIYTIYCLSIFVIFLLIASAFYFSWAFWEGLWHGSYISFFFPFVLNTHIVIALGLGAIPVGAVCLLVHKINNISSDKFSSIKRMLIWFPTFVCGLALCLVLYEIVIGLAFRNF